MDEITLVKKEISLYQSSLKEEIMKFRTDILRAIYLTFMVNIVTIIAGFASLMLLILKK